MSTAGIGLDTFKKGGNWKAYVEQLNSFITLKDIPEEKRKALLITQLSVPVYEILCSICAPDSPQDSKFSFEDLVKKLEENLYPQEYTARFELKQQKHGHQDVVKEYRFKEQLTEGVRSEALCFKVLKSTEGSFNDLIKIATKVKWAETETYEKVIHSNGNVKNQKSGLFALSQFRRTQQGRKKIYKQSRQRDHSQKQENAEVSTKLCYCCGKNHSSFHSFTFV